MESCAWITPCICRELKNIMLTKGDGRLYNKGALVASEDENRSDIYFVKSGVLCQTIVNQKLNKPYFILSLTLPGGIAGKVLLLKKNAHPVRIFAMKKSEIFIVKRDAVDECLNNSPSVREYFEAFRSAGDETEINGLIAASTLGSEERLKLFYRSLLMRCGCDMTADFVKLPVKFSRPEIGMIIYSTLQTINRHLAQWASSGLLKTSGGNYIMSPKLFIT